MPTCDRCGERIEFRYLDGQSTPIHVNGGWCAGGRPKERTKDNGWFRSAEAFIDPNAQCPVCGASVFYYQNSHGSRVFFDDLGWPWPKHPCTDNPASQIGKIKRQKKSRKRIARSAYLTFILYELDKFSKEDNYILLKFRSLKNRLIVRTIQLRCDDLRLQGWAVADLKDAPSFIIRRQSHQTIIEFISVFQGCIGNITVPDPNRVVGALSP